LTEESVRVTVVEQIPEDSQLASAWNALALGMERPEVFYTHQWALAASRAFADTLRPFVLLAYDADRLCGIAALAVSPKSLQTGFFLTSSTADYCDILSPPETRSEVLAALFDEIRRAGLQNLVLANVPADSATLRGLPQIANARGFHLHERAAYDCGVVAFGGEPERQALLQSVRRKERENRALKKIALLGSVHVVHGAAKRGEADLAPIFSAQIARFLAADRISPLVHPERRLFLTELSGLLRPAGWLKISRQRRSVGLELWFPFLRQLVLVSPDLPHTV
jgi:hypothetical protein